MVSIGDLKSMAESSRPLRPSGGWAICSQGFISVGQQFTTVDNSVAGSGGGWWGVLKVRILGRGQRVNAREGYHSGSSARSKRLSSISPGHNPHPFQIRRGRYALPPSSQEGVGNSPLQKLSPDGFSRATRASSQTWVWV